MNLSIPTISLLSLLLLSCGDGPLGGGPSRSNEMSATINGRGWTARWDNITATRTTGALSISGTGALDTSEIALLLVGLSGPGTYSLDSSSGNSAELITRNNVYRSRLLPHAGQIVLTRLDEEKAAGTFHFTARAVAQPVDTAAVVTVDGTFSVALVR